MQSEQNLGAQRKPAYGRGEQYGRHEETRTPDLYRVKVAL